jgi:hypothetical protein
MKEDPSEPPYRGTLQTAANCFGQKAAVLKVAAKERDVDYVRYERERRRQAILG